MVALAMMLLAVSRSSLMKDYKHPMWLQAAGWAVVAVMTYMAIATIFSY